MARLNWRGGEVAAKVATAAALAIDATMAEAVAHAKADHPGYPPPSAPDERFHSRTGFQVGSIQILEGARLEGGRVHGQWGSESNYALYLEIGTSTDGPTAQARAVQAAGDMHLIPPPIGPLMAPPPYLRPASDIEYPKLAARIAAAYEAGA